MAERKQHKSTFVQIITTEHVARMLAVSPGELNHLLSRLSRHYKPRKRPKPDGTVRILNVPSEPLKLLQRKINDHVLNQVPLLPCVLGGVRGNSPVTNANVHARQPVVFTMDIQSFFPTVNPVMVFRAFRNLGFGEEAAGVLTRMTTFDHQLPQGAPTSTALANLVMVKTDYRLAKLAVTHGFAYTRWVDDLTFSGNKRLLRFRNLIRKIVEDDGFHVNPDKTRVMFRHERQIVTKLTVNIEANVPKQMVMDTKREVAASLSRREEFSPSTLGKVHWIRSVNKEVGDRILRKIAGGSR